MSKRRTLFPGNRRASRDGDRTDPRTFATRHRFLLVTLLAQVPVLIVIASALDVAMPEIVAVSLFLLVMAVAGMVARGQLMAAGAVSFGLLTAAGVLVRYLESSAESFFAFFLALVAISFYQEIGLLLAGLAFVTGFHVFALLSLDPEGIVFRAAGFDLASPVAAVTLHLLLVSLLIAGWRMTALAETRRMAAADIFRIGFERSSVGMATLSPSGAFVHANTALITELGSLNGANIRSVVHSDDLDLIGQLWEDMGHAEDRTAESWLRLRTADGRAIWGRTSLSFIRATRNRPATILFQFDDDEAGYMKQTRFEAQIAGRDEFVAAISEDMRGPIRSVLDLTSQATQDPIDLQRVIRRIDVETKQIAAIVDDLLVSARAGATPQVARSVDAALLCREALVDVRGAGDVNSDVGDESVWADPGITVRILHSLVANAVRYGGRVVSLAVSGSGPDTVISVIDDGPAVPVPERDHMFEADLRSGLQPTRPASIGLSLAVSRLLARQMDGDITYRRTGDGHNVFELRLPSEPLRMSLDTGVEGMRIPA